MKEILAKIKEWWAKFTTRQRTVIISIVAAVVFTFVIIMFVLTKTQYTRLGNYETATQAAAVVEILESAGISHRETGNGLGVDVDIKQLSQANIALGAAGYVPYEYSSLSDVLSGGLSTTASDKEKLYTDHLRAKLERDLEQISSIKKAIVNLHVPEQVGTLLAQKQESSAYIQLELDGTFTSANAQNMAKAVQTFLGNENTANIVIVDSDANLLFSGEDDFSTAGVAHSMLELQHQAENLIDSRVKKVLLGTNQFYNIEVTSNLLVDYKSYEETIKKYYPNEGREEGMKAQESKYESESTNSGAAVPGAESNDGTVMVNPDGGDSSSTQTETEVHYLPNEDSKYIVTPAGSIDYGASSISIAMIKFDELHEEDAKSQGLLDGTTWEAYKAANSGDKKLEVDPDFYSMVAKATSMKEENITIIAYETPVFYDKEVKPINWANIISIGMLILILALLGFVILRSMSTQKEVAEEEELSVENLLQSTPDAELEDIDLETKSETRKMVEKFVDDNPEAAAALLRNWLNEEWG